MKTFKYKNATVHVRGEVDKEKLKNAAVKLLTKKYRYKRMRESQNDKRPTNNGTC